MLQNYLKLSFRNLLKHKTFSFINIVGLAISMSVCLLIMLNIKDAYSYDRFHPEGSERTYRILTDALRKDSGEETYASSPFPVSRALTEDYSQVELWTPLVNRFSSPVRVNGKELYLQGMFTDPTFFQMFGFKLLAGDPASALSEPFSVVLTEDWALRLFNQKDHFQALLGKTVELPGYGREFKITGVLAKAPGKTHLQFDALGSLSTQVALEKMATDSNQVEEVTTEWRNYYSTFNFIRLKPGAKVKDAEAALYDIAQNKLAGLELESRDKGYRYTLQALQDITPGPMLSQSMGNGVPSIVLWFMSGLGLIIMLCACFNYTNLTIARSLVRTKEVGVRKVLGAKRSQVFWQFIGEAVVVSLLALLLAYNILILTKPLNFLDAAEKMQAADWKIYVVFVLFALVIGFVAGALPAATLSKTSPLQVLQKLQNVKLIQRVGLRKFLIGFQFTVTLVFLFMMSIVWRQTNYGMRLNFGFDKPQTLLVELYGAPYEKLAAAFSKQPGVEKVSGISHTMGTWQDASADVRTDSVTEKTGVRDYFIDHNYLDHFGIELAAGENFPENPAQKQELFALVNERFCKAFKLGEPAEAVGKTLTLGDSTKVVVRGVMKDFLFRPATYGIEPLLLRYNPNHLWIMNVEVNSQNIPATLAALERTWNEMEKEREFSSQFFDAAVRQNYSDWLEISWTVGFLGGLGMVIACLGLLGMAIYTVETRAKEVSIRKVMGAGVRDVVVLLSKGYFIVLLIAILIAVPLSYLIGDMALQEFVQRAPLSVWAFLPGLAVVLAMAGLAVGSQTLRAALANPSEALRSE